jgi:glyoxylase I family protein
VARSILVIVWHLLADPTARFHDLSADGDDRFDEHRPGLDHLSFRVVDRAELKAWQARLEALGIPHGEIVDAHYGSGLSFRDPDNIALELFAPPGSVTTTAHRQGPTSWVRRG